MGNKPDGLDIERFEAMLASPCFAVFKARVTAELERSRTECETHADTRALHQAQGRCAGLRTVLDLPRIILREMKEKQ